MSSSKIRSLAAFLFAALLVATPVFAADTFTAAQKSAMDLAIKQYIMDNPQVLISSVEAYYNKQNAAKKVQEGPLKTFPAGLLDYPGTPSVGPKDAKVSVVEFFDYNCGYCKQVASDVQRLIDEDKSVRVIFKDLPILSDTSEVAARYALAADKQGKYLPYHMALLQHQGGITENYLLETAKSVGLDTDKLKKDAETQDARDVLAKNVALARELGVRGTPFFVIGKQKIPGAVGFSRLKEILAEERGDVPAASDAKAPEVKTDTVPEVKTDAIKSVPDVKSDISSKADTSSNSDVSDTSDDTNGNSEVSKARTEAQKMINDIREQAAAMQAQAAALQKSNEESLAAQKAKDTANAKK